MNLKKNVKMRSVTLIAMIMVIAVALAGCGGSGGGDSQKATYTLNQNGVEMKLTYYADGDRVTKQTAENSIPYSSMGVTTKEDAKKLLDPQSQKFQGIEGLDESIEYLDDKAVETLSVDYDKIDIEKAKGLPGMTFSGGDDVKKISLKKSGEMLEQQGYKKVE